MRDAELAARIARGHKTCNACGEIKSFGEFGRLSQSADGYDYRCKACQTARYQRWYAANHPAAERGEAIRAEREKRLQEQKKPCSKCGVVKSFAEFHKDPRKTDGLYSCCAICWTEVTIRRTKILNASPVSYQQVLEQHGMWCHICGGAIETRKQLQFDHVVPLHRGGPHSANNIRPAHAFCNISKGTKSIEEMMVLEQRFF